MSKDIKILLCAHKDVPIPRNREFFPIHVGKDVNHLELAFTPDNTGDNISAKNPHFCELTAHYWAWKNLKADIVGLNHYRRYFDFSVRKPFFSPDRRYADVDEFMKSDYRFPDFDRLLSDCDIVLPTPRVFPYSNRTQYCVFHVVNDWNILRDVIAELSPEYLAAFDEFSLRRNYHSQYNMFITRWELFAAYSEWMFKVLFEVERRVKLSGYPDQARLFGYLSERMLNVFCIRHNLRVKYQPVVIPLGPVALGANFSALRYNWWRLKNNLVFRLGGV
ncbi:MAG: DUF4422 domain-containing protein [Bacteroidaceae bacterium]|nr:DUF4422 domain-containing protein [Bacteroidaceae bacterium]